MGENNGALADVAAAAGYGAGRGGFGGFGGDGAWFLIILFLFALMGGNGWGNRGGFGGGSDLYYHVRLWRCADCIVRRLCRCYCSRERSAERHYHADDEQSDG